MKQLLTILILFSLSLTSFSQSQSEMNQTEYDKYLVVDKELNRVYNQILMEYKNDSTFIEKLKIAQRLWIKFRDAEVEMKFPEADTRFAYGSMYPMCESVYMTYLTNQCIEKLKEWLEPIPDGEACTGSVIYR